MIRSWNAVGTVVLATATATCGLFLLSGVAPAPTAAEVALPAVAPTDTTTTTTSTTTTTTTTTTSTTSTTTVPTTTVPPAPPIPGSVVASNDVVGAGGVVTFDGTCPEGPDGPVGPVVVWVIGEDRTVVDTGITSTSWTYAWTAPTDEADVGSFTFQFWCGDPATHDGGYPADLQRRVDMVASVAPTTSVPLVETATTLAAELPETD